MSRWTDDLPTAGPDDCERCYGDGRIADDDDGTAWAVWQALPAQSNLAMTLGWVKPIPCPECNGTGKR
jgi:hypothetical protein